MLLKNIKISTQLRLGLGLILVFVLLLGLLAWRQSDLLGLQTQLMYDHPLTVRRAVSDFETKVITMQREMTTLLLAEEGKAIEESLELMAVLETNAFPHLETLRVRYLGPPEDIAAIRDEFVSWNTARTETVHLVRERELDAARKRTGRSGVGATSVTALLVHTAKVKDFARKKADQFYREAKEQKSALNQQLAAIVALILLLSMLISYLLIEGIRRPLRELGTATDAFQQGRLSARSGFQSGTELGALSASFNKMAATIEMELRSNEDGAQLANVMLRETDARTFCRELLAVLLDKTNAQIGAFYLLSPDGTTFEPFESIGLSEGGRASFSRTDLEGELGAVLTTKKITRITSIAEDTPFTFAAASGTFRPKEIITIPMEAGGEITVVLSLASLDLFQPHALRLMEDILGTMTARMNGVLAYRKIQELAEQLNQKNQKLENQKSDLSMMTNELTEQNVELELQKKQLSQASRLKSTFLSNMSHELRTPLNSVIALTGVLGRKLDGKIAEQDSGYLEVIERNAKLLLSLINDILDLARIEAGQEDLLLVRAPLRPVVAEIIEMVEPQAKEKGILLINRVPESLPQVAMDVDKARQIFQNLVGNAVKFTSEGSVEISAKQQHGALQVEVRDTGIGIPEDQLPHIFDEFRQVDSSASKKHAGTGLGLAIVKKYAELMKGSISVTSVEGRGSTFTLKLPLEVNALVQDSHESAPHSVVEKILVVEDTEPMVLQLTDILSDRGYAVSVARNGREALETIGASVPDAVILDLMMPEMDGFTVLEQIRLSEETRSLPVLVLTAKDITAEETVALEQRGAHRLIRKGDVSKTELLAAVERMFVSTIEVEPHHEARKEKPFVLVVEDNPDNLQTMRALLEGAFTIFEAPDGRVGLEEARRHQPDVILMDIAMSGMDGFQALAAIRQEDELRHVPVVAVTASAMKGDREKILSRGFSGYVSKPIDEDLLKRTIKEVLDAR